jgi:hypothetical protein
VRREGEEVVWLVVVWGRAGSLGFGLGISPITCATWGFLDLRLRLASATDLRFSFVFAAPARGQGGTHPDPVFSSSCAVYGHVTFFLFSTFHHSVRNKVWFCKPRW